MSCPLSAIALCIHGRVGATSRREPRCHGRLAADVSAVLVPHLQTEELGFAPVEGFHARLRPSLHGHVLKGQCPAF
jgi:hypothetical protein